MIKLKNVDLNGWDVDRYFLYNRRQELICYGEVVNNVLMGVGVGLLKKEVSMISYIHCDTTIIIYLEME